MIHGQSYPEIWWAEVLSEEVPEWEILPHKAQKNEVILSKRNELGLLSNFAQTPFVYHGKKYASVEGFWQMLKFPESVQDERMNPLVTWKFNRDQVAQLVSRDAKEAGTEASQNMKVLGIDWVSFEGLQIKYYEKAKGEFYRLIRDVMVEKIKQNPEVREVLLRTGDLKLLPDHQQEVDAPPAWKYHEIWMEIRSELKRGKHAKI